PTRRALASCLPPRRGGPCTRAEYMSAFRLSCSLLTARFLLKQNSFRGPSLSQNSQWYLTSRLGGGGLAYGRGGAALFFWATWAVAAGSVSRGFLSSLGFGTQTC